MMPTPRETWHPDVEHVGRTVYLFDEVDSTQSVARALPPGSAVVADRQSAGRGQYGRTWTARTGSSLLLSVVLDPPPALRRAVVLTAWAAVAVGDAVRDLAGLDARIKWPNDLLVNGKKVCGILIEQGPVTACGIGLNVTQSADEFADDGLPDATSLAAETGIRFAVRHVADGVLRALDRTYVRLLSGDLRPLEDEWNVRLNLPGGHVVVGPIDGPPFPGRLRALRFDGVEIVTADGAVRVLVPEHVRQLRAV
jgi:BirA family biotin operon repressor/biotin-[acetyl-CoA-carboxylase] ligase